MDKERLNKSTLGFARLVMGVSEIGARHIDNHGEKLKEANRLMKLFEECYPYAKVEDILQAFSPLDRDLIISLVTEAIYLSNDTRVRLSLKVELPEHSNALSLLAERAAMAGVQQVPLLFPPGSSVHARHEACCDFVVEKDHRIIFRGEVKSVWRKGDTLKLGNPTGVALFLKNPRSILAIVDKSNLHIYYYLNGEDLSFNDLRRNKDSERGVTLHDIESLRPVKTVISLPLTASYGIEQAVTHIIEVINKHCNETLLPALLKFTPGNRFHRYECFWDHLVIHDLHNLREGGGRGGRGGRGRGDGGGGRGGRGRGGGGGRGDVRRGRGGRGRGRGGRVRGGRGRGGRVRGGRGRRDGGRGRGGRGRRDGGQDPRAACVPGRGPAEWRHRNNVRHYSPEASTCVGCDDTSEVMIDEDNYCLECALESLTMAPPQQTKGYLFE